MAMNDPIRPFPAEIDRDAFGHWLSGFADGEACFYAGMHRRGKKSSQKTYPYVRFALTLRADDAPVLCLIQSYLGGGNLRPKKAQVQIGKNSHQQAAFDVCSLPDLIGVVVPHFDRYPLRSKKARDYVIWREIVVLCSAIRRDSPWKGGRGHAGHYPRWGTENFQKITTAIESLRGQRKYADQTPVAV